MYIYTYVHIYIYIYVYICFNSLVVIILTTIYWPFVMYKELTNSFGQIIKLNLNYPSLEVFCPHVSTPVPARTGTLS
jgi:hypothetical protein